MVLGNPAEICNPQPPEIIHMTFENSGLQLDLDGSSAEAAWNAALLLSDNLTEAAGALLQNTPHSFGIDSGSTLQLART